MSVKTAYRAFFLPEWGGSVLKKRAAAWFTMRSWGLGIYPNKLPDGSYWPSGPCLLIIRNDIRKPRLPRKNGLAKQTIPLRCIYWARSATLTADWLLRSQGESLKPSCNLA